MNHCLTILLILFAPISFLIMLVNGFLLMALLFAVSVIVSYFMFGEISSMLLTLAYLCMAGHAQAALKSAAYKTVFRPKEEEKKKPTSQKYYADFLAEYIKIKKSQKNISDNTAWTLCIYNVLEKKNTECTPQLAIKIKSEIKDMGLQNDKEE